MKEKQDKCAGCQFNDDGICYCMPDADMMGCIKDDTYSEIIKIFSRYTNK